jgi:hypothetical protein
MSIITLNSKTTRPLWLHAVFDWLRQAKVAANMPSQSTEDLSDRHLLDIGAERTDVTRAIDRELGRLGLLDIGWQTPRRHGRR